jgi:hypothetical protein
MWRGSELEVRLLWEASRDFIDVDEAIEIARSDWIRFGRVRGVPAWVSGLGELTNVDWGIKLGGPRPPRLGPPYQLPFHLHFHEYNWWNPWKWTTAPWD